eukprot:2146494-Prymnesium_polylepis.1
MKLRPTQRSAPTTTDSSAGAPCARASTSMAHTHACRTAASARKCGRIGPSTVLKPAQPTDAALRMSWKIQHAEESRPSAPQPSAPSFEIVACTATSLNERAAATPARAVTDTNNSSLKPSSHRR